MDTKKEDQSTRKERHIRNLYRLVFGSPEGERVLNHLIKRCHILTPTFDSDPYAMAFKEGQRHVVLSIFRTVRRDDADLIKKLESGMNDHEGQ